MQFYPAKASLPPLLLRNPLIFSAFDSASRRHLPTLCLHFCLHSALFSIRILTIISAIARCNISVCHGRNYPLEERKTSPRKRKNFPPKEKKFPPRKKKNFPPKEKKLPPEREKTSPRKRNYYNVGKFSHRLPLPKRTVTGKCKQECEQTNAAYTPQLLDLHGLSARKCKQLIYSTQKLTVYAHAREAS